MPLNVTNATNVSYTLLAVLIIGKHTTTNPAVEFRMVQIKNNRDIAQFIGCYKVRKRGSILLALIRAEALRGRVAQSVPEKREAITLPTVPSTERL